MLTKKGKYGLKALVHLAQLEPGKTAFVSEIAEQNRCWFPRRTEPVRRIISIEN